MWLLGAGGQDELGLSVLVASTFIHWAISLALHVCPLILYVCNYFSVWSNLAYLPFFPVSDLSMCTVVLKFQTLLNHCSLNSSRANLKKRINIKKAYKLWQVSNLGKIYVTSSKPTDMQKLWRLSLEKQGGMETLTGGCSFNKCPTWQYCLGQHTAQLPRKSSWPVYYQRHIVTQAKFLTV